MEDSEPRWGRPSACPAIIFTTLVIGSFYLWCVQAANDPFDWSHDKVEFYDLLGRAFVQGQLHLPMEPAPELLALTDPWDPNQNERYAAFDLVLYNRRYYLYHGATPALLLFAPWRLITRHDLPEPFGAFLFCLLGYICSCALLLRLLTVIPRRPYLALLLAALGICQGVPFLLQRVQVYEVAIAAGYFCLSAAFWAVAEATLGPTTRNLPLAVSGLMFGLAVGSRPHLIIYAAFAGLALLLTTRRARPLVAFAAPLAACLIAIAIYNYARFANPFEFGLRYQLARSSYHGIVPSPANIIPGLYYLILSTPVWEPVFPFLRLAIRVPFHLPTRFFVEPIAGIVAICPAAIAAFANPRGIARTICLAAGVTTLAIASLGLVSPRYEMDFVPLLLLLACLLVAQRPNPFLWALLAYSALANLALGVQGPYDQFVQRHPTEYVAIARCFSPIARYRPLYNPTLDVQATFEFPQTTQSGPLPLIAAGRFGSHYQLTAEMLGGGTLRLTSASPLILGQPAIADLPVLPNSPIQVHLSYQPKQHKIQVDWNGQAVIRQEIPFLVTAPAQVTTGEYRTDFGASPFVFSGRVSALTKTVNGQPY